MKPVKPAPMTTNSDGFPAYVKDIQVSTLQTLTTNSAGKSFDSKLRNIHPDSKRIYAAMLEHDPEFFAKALVYARNEGFMRLQPITGLYALQVAEPKLFTQYAPKVLLYPTDYKDFLDIVHKNRPGTSRRDRELKRTGCQGGRNIMRVVKQFLCDLSEYHVMKYNGNSADSYSMKDLLICFHPIPTDERVNDLFKYIMTGVVNEKSMPQIACLDRLKSAQTDQERIDLIKKGKLPWEIVTSVCVPSKEIWSAIFEQMPLQALVKNMNTIERHDLVAEKLEYLKGRLNDPIAVAKSRMLPYQWLKANEHVTNPRLQELVRNAFELSFTALPDIKGTTAIYIDISGSMVRNGIEEAAVFGVSLFKKTNGTGDVRLFNTSSVPAKCSMSESIMSQSKRIADMVGGGTDTGACIREATEVKRKFDNIIVITDETQNTGWGMYDCFSQYQQTVHRNAKLFVVGVGGAEEHGAIPSKVNDAWYVHGLGPSVINFVAAIAKGLPSVVDYVNKL
jgi:60 kDa SS-A/Ro ribonucleoprotein